MAGQDAAGGTTPDAASFPGSEEFRMVRAIALLALMEAARHGEYRATFRGFRVLAKRQDTADRHAIGCGVNLQIRCRESLLEQIGVCVE